jgi:hypothetical protein
MNMDQFQNENQGKAYAEGNYGVQCVKGGKVWIESPHGWDMPATVFRPYAGNGSYGDDGALDGFYSFRDGFQSVVLNREGIDRSGRRYRIDIVSDQNQLQKGDLVFTTGRDQYGHVGVFVGRDVNVPGTFQLFDQNGLNPRSPAFWWSNYNVSTFVGAMRKVFLDQPQSTPIPQPTDKRFYTTKYGGWRWNVVQEIINAGIWGGTPGDNLPNFNRMNPVTPQDGWSPGEVVRIADDPQPPQVDSVLVGKSISVAPEPTVSPVVTPSPIQPQPEAISTPAPTPPMPHIEVPELPKQATATVTMIADIDSHDKIKALESQLSTSYDLARQLISKKSSILEKLKSRKLWATIVGVSYAICSVYYPEWQSVLPQVWTIIAGYIGVEGVADIIERNKK